MPIKSYPILQSLIHCIATPIEIKMKANLGKTGVQTYPPIFIIGAPRSGSTLIYKVLADKFNLTFFSNLTAFFYKIPILIAWFEKKIRLKHKKENYDFKYGDIKGLGAPSECGEFWYRWFHRGLNVYVAPGQTPVMDLKELRTEIGGVTEISNQPLIIKNLYNSMRIAPIVEAIPEASFIICRRNYTENALSILKGRINNMHSKNKWWSLPPKEINHLLSLPWAEQIAGQIHYIYKQIEEDKKRFGIDRFFEIIYEDFCDDVHSSVKKIEDFLSARRCYLVKRDVIPKQFHTIRVNGINPKDRKMVKKAVQNIIQTKNK